MIKNIELDADIIPGCGIGEIQLGMNFNVLKGFLEKSLEARSNFDELPWKFCLKKDHSGYIDIEFKKYLIISIDPSSCIITHLRVRRGYSGKVYGSIGIGDPVKAYFNQQAKSYVGFHNGSFYFDAGRHGDIAFYIGKQYTREPSQRNWKRYLSRPIRQIEIRDNPLADMDEHKPASPGKEKSIHLYGIQLQPQELTTQEG